MKILLAAFLLSVSSVQAFAKSEVRLVRVFKSERRMELVGHDRKVIKSYNIMLGGEPVGHKVQEGDNKTPEGVYYLDSKNPKSKYRKSIHVSYPNAKDKAVAKSLGVSPGGDIMIHGLPNDFKQIPDFIKSLGLEDLSDDLIRRALTYVDWTQGCIAVTDAEIEEIYSMIELPTKIIIRP